MCRVSQYLYANESHYFFNRLPWYLHAYRNGDFCKQVHWGIGCIMSNLENTHAVKQTETLTHHNDSLRGCQPPALPPVISTKYGSPQGRWSRGPRGLLCSSGASSCWDGVVCLWTGRNRPACARSNGGCANTHSRWVGCKLKQIFQWLAPGEARLAKRLHHTPRRGQPREPFESCQQGVWGFSSCCDNITLDFCHANNSFWLSVRFSCMLMVLDFWWYKFESKHQNWQELRTTLACLEMPPLIRLRHSEKNHDATRIYHISDTTCEYQLSLLVPVLHLHGHAINPRVKIHPQKPADSPSLMWTNTFIFGSLSHAVQPQYCLFVPSEEETTRNEFLSLNCQEDRLRADLTPLQPH